MSINITIGNLEILSDFIIPEENWIYINPKLIPFGNTITIKVVMNDGTIHKKNIYLVNYSEESFDESILDTDDNDGDGLPNWIEDVFGTDKNNPDTDGDGVNDYNEFYILFTDPLLYDTGGNGINDGDEDFDSDGLTNSQECFYGTAPFKPDTDSDTLSDYDEIFVYFSDPLLMDSDFDELPDVLEIKYGMNPMNPDTLGDGILDGERKFTVTLEGDFSDNGMVKPVLTIDLQGKQIEDLTINKVSEDDIFLNTKMPGYLGNAFDFNVNGEFDSATLTYEFDSSLLDEPDFVPIVYYWNEEIQFLEELPNQSIDGNKVSVPIEHFSIYLLLNKTIRDYELFLFDILAPVELELQRKSIDLSLVIDNSGSMSKDSSPKNDKDGLRHILAKDFIDKLDDNDRVCVVNFASSAVLQTSFTSNKTTAKKAIDTYTDGGTTALYNAINVANKQFASNSKENVTKIMIVLTDGINNESGATLSAVTEAAVKNGIIIYTIGLGSSLDLNALNSLADLTGGAYYHAANASKLYEIFDKLKGEVDLYKDSDGDGISDYHEKEIAAGRLRTGSGAPLKNYEKMNYLNANSDGDNLNDGEEIDIVTIGKIIYMFLRSNPLMEDTDNDGICDSLDAKPLKKFDERFTFCNNISYIPENDTINELQRKSDESYNTISLWEKFISWNYYQGILFGVTGNVLGGSEIIKMPNAANFIRYFVNKKGELYEFDAKEVIEKTNNGIKYFNDNMDVIMSLCEETVVDKLLFTTKASLKEDFAATKFSDEWVYETNLDIARDWHYSIGNSTAVMTFECVKKQNKYIATVKYYILDFYDWEENSDKRGGFVVDGQMYDLHCAGLAKQFPVRGTYSVEFEWEKGQRFNKDKIMVKS